MSTTFSPLSVYRKTFRRSRASNSKANSSNRPEIKLFRDLLPVLFICIFEEDQIKTEGTIVSTFFSGTQTQVTSKSMDRCGLDSNSSEIL